MSQRDQLLDFIVPEICVSTWKASSATRGSKKCIYITQEEYESQWPAGKYQKDRDKVKSFVYNYLNQIYIEVYKQNVVLDERYILSKITQLSQQTTQKHAPVLVGGSFRIGIAQKVVLLFLKYLWALDIICEPPLCPIDGQIKLVVLKQYTAVIRERKRERLSKAKYTRQKSIRARYKNLIKGTEERLVDWTQITKLEDVEYYFKIIKRISNGSSLAVWELENWVKPK